MTNEIQFILYQLPEEEKMVVSKIEITTQHGA